MKRLAFLIVLIISVVYTAVAQKNEVLHFTVESGLYQRINTPVFADLNGAFKDNGLSGITFFSHPANRAHPEPMRVWPESQNGRGDVYFEFCPTRFTDWALDPGNIYRLKYRMLIYDGKIDKSAGDRIWNDFAYPPQVKVISK